MSKDTDELNILLKEEYKIIDNYERIIDDINNEYIKEELEKIKHSHEDNAKNLSERIDSLGAKPRSSRGILLKAEEFAMEFKGEYGKGLILKIKEAYDREQDILERGTDIIKTDLDNYDSNLIKGILDRYRNHLQTLYGLINTTGSIY